MRAIRGELTPELSETVGIRMPSLPLKGYIVGDRLTLEVCVDGVVLDPSISQKVRSHSDQFCWGYHGSGPSQLALALLLNFGATSDEALSWYQDFKRDVIAEKVDSNMNFELPTSIVEDWLESRRIFAKEFKE